MTRPLRSSLAALLAAGLLLLASCGGGNGFGGSLGSGASVRLLNATPDFASLDLYRSTDRVVSSTALSTVSDYADTDSGSYTYNLETTGSSAVAASVSGSIDKHDHATVVAYTTGGALNATFLTDQEGDPSSNTAKVRIFNAAKNEAGAVDVYFVGSDCSGLASVSVAATATNVSDLQTSYTEISAGSGGTSYHLCVTASGDKSDVRLDVPAYTLKEKEIVTLIFVKTSGGVLLNGLALDQQGSLLALPNASARIRVAAGASASGTIGATVNGVSLGNYASPDVGGYTLVPAGTLAATITINGTPVSFPNQTAAAGADLTLLVAGTATAPTTSLLVDDNTPSTSTSKPVRIRLVNGFIGSGTVTLSVDGTNVGNGAAPGTASATALVAASSQTTRLKATGANGQLYLTENNTLVSGSVYSLFLLGDPPNPLPGLNTGILRVDR